MKSIRIRHRRYAMVSALGVAAAVAGLGGSYAFAAESPEWSVTETPDLGKNYSLKDVEVAGPDDVWAVGHTLEQGWDGTVALHWDGQAWEQSPTPEGLALQDMEMTADGDSAWAVGKAEEGALVTHWDGEEWQQVDTPDPEVPAGQDPVLHGVDAEGSQPWAVGCSNNTDWTAQTAFAQFYDGQEWQLAEVPLPEWADHSCLNSVEHVASDEVWAVGQAYDGSGGEIFVVRWDGEQWNLVDMPEVEHPDAALTGVMAPAVGFDGEPQIYAAGFVKDDPGDIMGYHPAMFTYDGEEWTQVDVPDADGLIYGLGTGPGGSVWMSGYTHSGEAILMGYSGGTVDNVEIPQDNLALFGVATGPDSDSPTWVVGDVESDDEDMSGFAAHAAP